MHLTDHDDRRIEKEANTLAVLVKGDGWGRYSVSHLCFWGRRVKQLDRKFAFVTQQLVAFNAQTFVSQNPFVH